MWLSHVYLTGEYLLLLIIRFRNCTNNCTDCTGPIEEVKCLKIVSILAHWFVRYSGTSLHKRQDGAGEALSNRYTSIACKLSKLYLIVQCSIYGDANKLISQFPGGNLCPSICTPIRNNALMARLIWTLRSGYHCSNYLHIYHRSTFPERQYGASYAFRIPILFAHISIPVTHP